MLYSVQTYKYIPIFPMGHKTLHIRELHNYWLSLYYVIISKLPDWILLPRDLAIMLGSCTWANDNGQNHMILINS